MSWLPHNLVEGAILYVVDHGGNHDSRESPLQPGRFEKGKVNPIGDSEPRGKKIELKLCPGLTPTSYSLQARGENLPLVFQRLHRAIRVSHQADMTNTGKSQHAGEIKLPVPKIRPSETQDISKLLGNIQMHAIIHAGNDEQFWRFIRMRTLPEAVIAEPIGNRRPPIKLQDV